MNIAISPSLLKQLDELRGDVNRSLFVQRLIEKRLKSVK